MRNIFIRTLLLFSLGVLTVFAAATLIVADYTNKAAARDYAGHQLGVFRALMEDGGFSDDLEKMAGFARGKGIRVTVIAENGAVLAESDTSADIMEDHSGRKEVKAALKNREAVGSAIRKSATLGVELLYVAKAISVAGADAPGQVVVLRVAVPIKNINSYLYGTIGITVVIFIAVFILAVVVSRFATAGVNKPFMMIKEKLGDILKPGAESKPIVLTKHDDINTVLQDIDEISEKLKSTLDGYQSERHKIDLILSHIDQGIMALDPEENIIACNKPAENYFCFDYAGPVPVEKAIRNRAILDNVKRAIYKNEFISYDHTRVNGDIYEVRFLPVLLKEISLLITAQNVTELRKTSLEKQEFFANAGHELNTPLSSILGYSELLSAQDTYNKSFVETIHREALRMKALIGDMLSLSALEERAPILEETVDLGKTAGEAVAAYERRAAAKNIALTLIAGSEPVFIQANQEKMTEVFSNLIDNAIKYTDPGGVVAVAVKKQNGHAAVSVKDNGIGIERKHLPRIFERFYRTDKGRSRVEGGTGLGLAIVKHICTYYGALVTVSSKEGLGTEVAIEFK
ncbi:MAG: ATP-binding protein [Firmicutes bacterium]|nr:ATP-binding protein [Bacillota bacterium]